jgi:hypothetical protein
MYVCLPAGLLPTGPDRRHIHFLSPFRESATVRRYVRLRNATGTAIVTRTRTQFAQPAPSTMAANVAVIGIDVGNQSCVISQAKRGGIDVILNENSKRLTRYVARRRCNMLLRNGGMDVVVCDTGVAHGARAAYCA